MRGHRFGRSRRRLHELELDLRFVPGSDKLVVAAFGGGGRGAGNNEVVLLLGWGSAEQGEAQGGRHSRRHPRARLQWASVRR